MSDKGQGSGDADPWTKDVRNKFEGKNRSEFFDPCQEAAQMSIRCLHRNGGDRAMCQDYFQAYRDCKKIWIDKRSEERRKRGGSFGMLWKSLTGAEDTTNTTESPPTKEAPKEEK